MGLLLVELCFAGLGSFGGCGLVCSVACGAFFGFLFDVFAAGSFGFPQAADALSEPVVGVPCSEQSGVAEQVVFDFGPAVVVDAGGAYPLLGSADGAVAVGAGGG
jgi:hypothetical protein